MKLYTIMGLYEDHLEDVCQDIKTQYETGVANCALFMIKLVPEGDPAIDKASIEGAKYEKFQRRLSEMGLPSGILAQCTIGHGYALNQKFGFQPYINLLDGKEDNVVCPYDEAARDHFFSQFKTLASRRPDVIMVDDDFRLMFRHGQGCTCPLHMRAIEERIGKHITREQLRLILKDKSHPDNALYTEHFVATQREALLGMAQRMRDGIDAVDPTLPGVFCSVGQTTEFGAEIAKILAGRGNPTVVRLNNGNYTPEGARYLSAIAYRAAQQSRILREEGADVILAETDTCPQNRYSTGAQSLHAHFTASILEGVAGAKHWITRLESFEPQSGVAYRKKLAQNKGFYEKLSELYPRIRYMGCRIPRPRRKDYELDAVEWGHPTTGPIVDQWSRCVLERFGVPIYFSAEEGGAAFLEGSASRFSREELEEMLDATLFIASDTAMELCEMGYADRLGVSVTPWTGPHTSFERFGDTDLKAPAQMKIKCLTPIREGVRSDSTVYHVKDGKEEIALFPGVTVFDNDRGGHAVVFSGTPHTHFNYYEAFSFLTEARKAQIVRLLDESGNLPIYYVGDEEVYMKAGTLDSSLFVALFNIGLDPIDEIRLFTKKQVKSVRMLTNIGEFKEISFRTEENAVVIETPLSTLDPRVFLLD